MRLGAGGHFLHLLQLMNSTKENFGGYELNETCMYGQINFVLVCIRASRERQKRCATAGGGASRWPGSALQPSQSQSQSQSRKHAAAAAGFEL